ncbi:MAG: GMP synthase [Bacteroidota bacterium]
MREEKMKLAILDLYDGEPNQGMRAIKSIVETYKDHFDYTVFDVRGKAEVPDTSYDVYISSGGPGSPLDGDGIWNKQFFDLIDQLWAINQSGEGPTKYAFFICHSFQMVCDHFDLARVLPRKSRAFGTFPAHMTPAGSVEPYFAALPNPFCVADFRLWQVVQPDHDAFEAMGAKILALEKIRPHVPLERAIMAIRFSRAFFGVQFHPEADPEGMRIHFGKAERKAEIIKKHGAEKFERMMSDLEDEKQIPLTFKTILPTFLDDAIQMLAKIPQAM